MSVASFGAHQRPQHCLYFFPLPHGQGSFLPTFGPTRMGFAFETTSLASLTRSLCCALLVVVSVAPKALVAWCTVVLGMLRANFSKAIKLDALRKMLWQISDLIF